MNPDSVIIRCGQCETKNRIPKQRLSDRPVCGKCKAPLATDKIYNTPVMVTDQTFQQEVLDHPGPVMLDCWAQWCGPCHMMTPILNELARDYGGLIKIAKLNVDQNPITASRFHVLSVPTLLLFKNGQMINAIAGALNKSQLLQHLRSIL